MTPCARSDLCHILHKLDRPLPLGAREFAARLVEVFPCVIDTKHLLHNVPTLQCRSASSSLVRVVGGTPRPVGGACIRPG